MKHGKIILGLTGGIGSGKTSAAKFFEELGIPVYNADNRAKILMNENKIIKQKLIDFFGQDAYHNNELNRKFIAQETFNNKEKLQVLNGIVHPEVFKDNDDWIKNQTSKLVMKEAAIMIESGSYKDCDELILVSAEESIRIDRVLERDQTTREEVKKRINNQLSEEERKKYANFIINNNSDLDHLKQEVNKTLKAIKEKYNIL